MTPKLIDTTEIKNVKIDLIIATIDFFNLFITFSSLLPKFFGAGSFETTKSRFSILNKQIYIIKLEKNQ